jgi:hypothetical protein
MVFDATVFVELGLQCAVFVLFAKCPDGDTQSYQATKLPSHSVASCGNSKTIGQTKEFRPYVAALLQNTNSMPITLERE